MGPDWIDRLERRFGFLAVPGPAAFLAGMTAAVGLLANLRPDFIGQLILDPELLRRGQVWRLATFVFVPPDLGPLWLVLWLVLFYSYLKMLENAWGEFKLTLYCAVGAAAAGLASWLFRIGLSNEVFDTSLFLAFARLHPDFSILFFFLFPVRMRWLAAVVWALTGASLLLGGGAERVAIASGLANYALFFGPEHWARARAWGRRLGRAP